ncbi:hypothetical protein FQN54_003826 [Arachnomyces sp. PD_36]|nr:hypothetical protein FQN54_003826 [Arachnomyces sp. PD_36]
MDHPLLHLAAALGTSYYFSFPIWQTLTLAFAATNLRSLPLISYHARLLPSLFRLFVPAFQPPPPTPPSKSAPSIFHKESVTSSRCCALDCDINFHKSNSTFLTDLDINRAELLSQHFPAALNKLSSRGDADEKGKGKRVNLILGAVHTSFHREIKPYQRYEVKSRILAWDEKWIFVVSYFVKPGTVISKVAGEALLEVNREATDLDAKKSDGARPGAGIFATAVSRYVLKKGRVTVPPEMLMGEMGFLGYENGRAAGEGWSKEKVEEVRQAGAGFAEGWLGMDRLRMM